MHILRMADLLHETTTHSVINREYAELHQETPTKPYSLCEQLRINLMKEHNLPTNA